MERVKLDYDGDHIDTVLFKGMPAIHPQGFGGNIWSLPVGNMLILRNEDNDYRIAKTSVKITEEYFERNKKLKELLQLNDSTVLREYSITKDRLFIQFRKGSNLELGTIIEGSVWEGKSCKATVCEVIIEDENGFNDYWAKPFIGMKRKAIMVEQDGDSFILDNEDGSGLVKLLFPNEIVPYAHLKASIIHYIKSKNKNDN